LLLSTWLHEFAERVNQLLFMIAHAGVDLERYACSRFTTRRLTDAAPLTRSSPPKEKDPAFDSQMLDVKEASA
jgi:hypothetical protein